MTQLLGLTLLSLFITAILIVPFIDFLYKIKLQRQRQVTVDLFNKRTPILINLTIGKLVRLLVGGLLIIFVTTIVFLWSFGMLKVNIAPWELFVILLLLLVLVFWGFMMNGKKLINGDRKIAFFGLRFRYKLYYN